MTPLARSDAARWVEWTVRAGRRDETFNLTDDQARCVDVISATEMGPHNVQLVGGWSGVDFRWPNHIVLRVRNRMGTYDCDRLTRLVLAAHQHLVRVEFCPHSAMSMKVHLDARKPRADNDHMFQRHPDLAELGLKVASTMQRGAR